MDELDMATGGRCELLEILEVDGHDLIPIRCEQHDSSVDDIGQSGGGKELPSGSAQSFVECANIDASEYPGQTSLTRTAAPHLPENSCVGERFVSIELRRLEADPHRAFVALERNQRPAVEHEAHADFALRDDGRPRTTVACWRSSRRWTAISSALISPKSFS